MIKTLILKLGSFLTFNRKSKVIYYHDISGSQIYTDMGTPVSLFEKHIEILKQERFEIVSEITKPTNQIQICFDDGSRGIYDHRKYLIENNIKPTVFLAISLIGQQGYLLESEIRALQKEGFRFQSHSVSHQNLTSFDNKELAFELEHSKQYLEALLNEPVEEICFPIGYFSDRVINASIKAGYKKLYSSLPGNYRINNGNPIKYRNLVQFLSPEQFKAVLFGGMSLLRSWYRRTHFIKTDPIR